MYSDPSLIRKHAVKLSFSDEEYALIVALAEYRKTQKATLLHELLMEQVRLEVDRLEQSAATAKRNKGTK